MALLPLFPMDDRGRCAWCVVSDQKDFSMPTLVNGYAAHSSDADLVPWSFERRDLRPDDVELNVLFCGVCHSDIHHVRNDWGGETYPMVPGHEIVGVVTRVGRM